MRGPRQRSTGLLLLVVSAWLALLVAIVVNIATGGQPPGPLRAYRDWAWPALLVLALVATGVQVLAVRRANRPATDLLDVLDADAGAHPWLSYRPRALARVGEYLHGRLDTGTELHLAVRRPEAPDVAVDLVEAYDRDGSVLLVGVAGAGKTTLLIGLAAVLLDRARADPEQPIPVLVALSGWGQRRARRLHPYLWRRAAAEPEPVELGDWLLGELRRQYRIKAPVARAWLAQHRLALLLDGLDEIRPEVRTRYARQLDRLVRADACPPIVVTCRADDLPIDLRLADTLRIAPLTRAQVDAYVGAGGARLAGLGRALAEDEALGQLMDAPLWLRVAERAYRDGSATLTGPLRGTSAAYAAPRSVTVEQRRRQLLDAYLADALERRRSASRYGATRTLRWLAQFARLAGAGADPLTVDLRRIYRGAALPSPASVALVGWVVAPLIATMWVVGVTVPVSVVAESGGLWGSILTGPTLALLWLLVAFLGSFFSLGRPPTRSGYPLGPRLSPVRWLAGTVAGYGLGVLLGLLVATVGAGLAGLVRALPAWSVRYVSVLLFLLTAVVLNRVLGTRRIRQVGVGGALFLAGLAILWPPMPVELSTGLGYGLAAVVGFLITIGLSGWGEGGGSTQVVSEWLVRRALSTLPALYLLHVVLLWDIPDVAGVGSGLWLVPSLVVGLAVGALPGAVLAGLIALLVRPLVLRLTLGWTGMMPWRLGPFLREVAGHGLVTRAGPGRRFLHGLLFEHLVRVDPLDAVPPDPAGAEQDERLRAELLGRVGPATRAGTPGGTTGTRAAYEEAGRVLVVLGEADARTEALRDLTASLLDDAGPVPVLLRLDTWRRQYRPAATAPTRPFVRWLLDQLHRGYGIPEGTGLRWLAAGQLVLLLDGFEAVPEKQRPWLAGAVEEFRLAYPATGLVLASAPEAYQKLPDPLGLTEFSAA